jgi:glycine oxidase
MLAPVTEAIFGETELTRLNLLAVDRFPDFVRELEDASGESVGLRRDGTLAVALNADDRAALDRLTAFRTSLGLATRRLAGSAARRMEPYLATDVRAGVFAADDLSVDNRRYLNALRTACDRGGVRITRAEVASVLTEVDGCKLALTVHGERVPAGAVVLCAGAATGRLTDLPIQPVKGQILRLEVPQRLRSAGPVLGHTVRGLVRGSEVYLVPREDGEVVVGASSEHLGWDTSVTAGGVYELLRNAYELVPISSEFTFLEARAGLRPGTPDNGPIVGTTADGLIAATGHYRNGILLSSVTADAVTALIGGEDLAEEWKPFSPSRFQR